MVMNTKAIIKMEKEMEKEHLNGKMVLNTLDNGLMDINKGKLNNKG